MAVIALVLMILLGLLWYVIDKHYRVDYLKLRRNHERLWRVAFTEEEFDSVDKMLREICDSFCIPRKMRFRIKPSDKIEDFYKKSTRLGIVDSMEYECLSISLEKEFHIRLDNLLAMRSCTVEDLIRQVAAPLERLNFK